MICHHSRILIVGAGIAGLATYLALKLKGLNADIIEKHSQLSSEALGLLLTSNAVEASKELGIYAQLKEQAFIVNSIQYRDEKNRLLMDFSKNKHFPESAEFLSVHKAQILNSLADWLPENAIQFNLAIAEIKTKSQTTQVTFTNGERKDYDLVIAADGINSYVRQEFFKQSSLVDSGLYCTQLILPKPVTMLQANYFIGKGRAASLLPIDNNLLYCPFVFNQSLIKEHKQALPLINQLFGHFKGKLADVLRRIDSNSQLSPITPYKSLNMNSWVHHNTVLIGNAAHTLIPTQPQGAAIALEDSVVLADCLANCDNVPSALNSYQVRRFSRVKSVQMAGEQRLKAIQLSRSKVGQILVRNMMKFNGERRLKKDWAKLILAPA
ncbi:FAD-dependent monooxygenase [Litorilituus sediminis]|uniref:FAD-binding domain-containing protein n=1 Tax=Litorilituus sediminis TaxID=718192 RepID=A0A4P6P7X7_9GAMM|nr:FAD-dependent monooxygenase [Litorilituus sediminis]QBG36359.1 hypothetical protein EMK97_11865 [Litorilituus sediminis]